MALQVVNETAISYIVQIALDKALSCLQSGFELFGGAENHLVKIRDSLKEIRGFIVIAEGSPTKDPKLMELLEKLKDAAYDAEDLLEEYAIEDRRRSEEAESRTSKVRRVVTSLVTITPVINRAQMPIKLKELSERLEAIKAEGHTFRLKEKVTDLMIEFEKQRETHSLVNKSQVFGRDEEKKKIVSLLLSPQPQVGDGVEDDENENENVSVIPIVGMGGLGKTTLAKLVFDHGVVQNHFELRMWICVSYDFDIIRLGNEIIERAIRHNPNLSNVEELQLRLGETLSGKKFLLVLDDVWNEEPEKWYRLRDLLLCGGRGSRIVVTTRSQKVALIISNMQPHILKPLPEDGCWSLFCQRAFRNPKEAAAHPNLAPIGREIVKKCGGNPLAVTTLGGLLCSDRSQRKWEFVRDSEMWNLDDENEHGILPALRLSYKHLKPHLKQCFAFCAIFPQDYTIRKELVIKLWMAQGFIPTKRGMELEDTGDEIFEELVMKSFFQDVKEINYDFHPIRTTFRMHDLMHDLAHSVMENEYCVVHDGQSKDISPRIRHVSSNSFGILPASLPKAQMLRTYVLLVVTCPMIEEADFQFPCDVGLFKCLRALDFMWQDKQEVEKQLLTSLGNLQHLRYLNLSFTLIEMLPESLNSLCYLQTLILVSCRRLCELPKEMSKLTNLRCLDITDSDKLTHMPPKMGQLSCLQELNNFIVGRTNEIACSGIGELQGLNHLRGRLGIRLLKNITDAIDVPRDTLINKPNLTALDLMWEDSMNVELGDVEEDGEIEQVPQGLQPHGNLKKLRICHYGGLNFPNWIMDTTLTELVQITLLECWRCNHLPPLGELPFLKVLAIDGLKNVECIGNEFYGNEVSGGFPSLEQLVITRMKKLKTWSGLEWKGEKVFPSLVRLEISDCPMLTTIEIFLDIKDLSMHQQNCNQSSFADEDQIRSQSSLQYLSIECCDKLIFSGLGLRYLSSLETLRIVDSNEFAHVAHELSFLTSLQYLTLEECHGLKSLPEGIGNLTSLQHLDIYNCPEMASLPRELQCLSALKYLSIRGCHSSLEIRCTKDTGEDWDKIQHISYTEIVGHPIYPTQVGGKEGRKVVAIKKKAACT